VQDAITGQIASNRPFELDHVQVVEGSGLTPVGTGCPGSGMLAPVLLSNFYPSLGNASFSVTIMQGIPGNMAYLFASFGIATTPVALGGGCTLYLDPPGLASFLSAGIGPTANPIGATGLAYYPLPIPPSWPRGPTFAIQAALADPSYLPTGFSVTNALLITIL
jgi:hypothetical protein